MHLVYWFSCAVASFVAYLLYNRASQKHEFPPKIPGALPIIGHGHKLTHPGVYKQLQKQYGDMYRVLLSGRETVVIHDLEIAKSCLRADSEVLGFSVMVEQLLGFDQDVSKYAVTERGDMNLQVMKQHIFPRIARSEPIIVQSCIETIDRKLKASGSKEIDVEISQLAMLIVGASTGKYLFDLTLPLEFYEECSKLEAMQQKAFAIMSLIWIRWRPFKRLVWREYLKNADRLIKTYLAPEIALCRANPGRSHFVDTYANLPVDHDRSGVGLYSDHEIGHLMVIFVLVSMTNTTMLTTHTIASLMKNSDYLARVQKELSGVAPPTAEDTKESNRFTGTVPILDAVVHECARIAVMNLGSIRMAVQDYDITDPSGKILYTLAAGNLVMIPHAVKNHNEDVFADPMAFNPERFLTPSGAKKSDVMNWGGGVHMCPGKNLALQEARIIAATLLSHYDVKPKDLDKYGDIVWHSAAGVAISPLGGTNVITIKNL